MDDKIQTPYALLFKRNGIICSVIPLGAQSQSHNYGEITCTGLRVVDSLGIPVVFVKALKGKGGVWVQGEGRVAEVVVGEHSAVIGVYGEAGGTGLVADKHGAHVKNSGSAKYQ